MIDLPAERLENIHAYLRGATKVAMPRDAATVVLLRDGISGLEVYLLRRRSSMSFGSGMHVFPGGSMDPRDMERIDSWVGPSPTAWAQAFACANDVARALVCAAVRETFEESGVLLAGTAAGEAVGDTSGSDWESDRLALIEGSLSFAAFLSSRSLLLRTDFLHAWSHWITPEWSPRRFDTRFFVASVPPGQQTRDVGGEADFVAWLPVAEAFDRYKGGSLQMMLSTASTLRDLKAHSDVVSALSETRQISPIMVRPVLINDGFRLVFDAETGEVPTDELVRP